MDQLQLPMSIFVYFQETPLTIERKDLQFWRGREGDRERATSAIGASMHQTQEQEPAGDAPHAQLRQKKRGKAGRAA